MARKADFDYLSTALSTTSSKLTGEKSRMTQTQPQLSQTRATTRQRTT